MVDDIASITIPVHTWTFPREETAVVVMEGLGGGDPAVFQEDFD